MEKKSRSREKWADIDGYFGIYQISTIGNVRRVLKDRTKLLVPWVNNTGYMEIGLSCRYIKKSFKVHRLVGFSFIPNPLSKPQINHKNGIRDDNRLSNLEWVTISENQLHRDHVLGHKNKRRKLNKVQVFEILRRNDKRCRYILAKKFNVAPATIKGVKCGNRYPEYYTEFHDKLKEG